MARTPDQWADSCRHLPPGSAEPGPWRSHRTPYMIPIVRACAEPHYKRIIAVMGSQMGKTAGLFNVMGHRLDDDPAPLIYVGPTRSNIDHVVEPKFMAMLKGVPSLWKKRAKGKRQTQTHKQINEVSVRFAWAGSATELASDSAVVVLVDEIDRMESNVQGEGSVFELAEARTSTYPDGKVIGTSTPTLGVVETALHPLTGLEHWAVSESVVSPIWRLWQEGTRCEWAWPCPHCESYFIPRLKHLWWPEQASLAEIGEKAALVCPCCGALITDQHKTRLNSRGVFLAPGQSVNSQGDVSGQADTAFSDTASFWVSGLCSFSSKKSLGYLAKKIVAAQRSGESARLQSVLNTDFGELYGCETETPTWQVVAAHQQDYCQGEVPEQVSLLTAGVDVQKNRLVYVVRGWGQALESWLISYGEFWGETDKPNVWQMLSGLLAEQWQGHPLGLMAIDSGYQTPTVYRFCRLHKGLAVATKGHETLDKPYKKTGLESASSKAGLGLWHFNSDQMKSWIHSRLTWPVDQPGGWWLPSDISEDYCKQMVAEQRTVGASGKIIWLKVRRDNHYLDAEALAYLAVRLVTGDREERIGSTHASPRRSGVLHPGIRFVGGELVDPPPMGEAVRALLENFAW